RTGTPEPNMAGAVAHMPITFSSVAPFLPSLLPLLRGMRRTSLPLSRRSWQPSHPEFTMEMIAMQPSRIPNVCLALLVLWPASLAWHRAAESESKLLYMDATQPIEVRVDDLMKRMTLKEKIGQLNLPCAYVDQLGKTAPEKIEAARKFS